MERNKRPHDQIMEREKTPHVQIMERKKRPHSSQLEDIRYTPHQRKIRKNKGNNAADKYKDVSRKLKKHKNCNTDSTVNKKRSHFGSLCESSCSVKYEQNKCVNINDAVGKCQVLTQEAASSTVNEMSCAKQHGDDGLILTKKVRNKKSRLSVLNSNKVDHNLHCTDNLCKGRNEKHRHSNRKKTGFMTRRSPTLMEALPVLPEVCMESTNKSPDMNSTVLLPELSAITPGTTSTGVGSANVMKDTSVEVGMCSMLSTKPDAAIAGKCSGNKQWRHSPVRGKHRITNSEILNFMSSASDSRNLNSDRQCDSITNEWPFWNSSDSMLKSKVFADAVENGDVSGHEVHMTVVRNNANKVVDEKKLENRTVIPLSELETLQMLEAMQQNHSPIHKSCYVCGYPVTSLIDYMKHGDQIHRIRFFPCPRCFNVLSSMKQWRRHIKFVCNTKPCCKVKRRSHSCDLCPKCYAYKRNLVRHVSKVHRTSDLSNIGCTDGNRSINTIGAKRTSTAACTIAEEKKDVRICLSCKKTFASRQSLYYHRRTIHREEIFTCTCGMTFLNTIHYYRHRKICSHLDAPE